MKIRSLAAAAALSFAVLGSSVATAATPSTGQWIVVVTTGPKNVPFNTVGICMQFGGTWVATSDKRGSGRWLVSGSSVLWRGNYSGGLNDAAVLSGSATAMSGPLMQWVAGTTDTTNVATENVYGTSTWRFVGAKCDKAL